MFLNDYKVSVIVKFVKGMFLYFSGQYDLSSSSEAYEMIKSLSLNSTLDEMSDILFNEDSEKF